MCIYRAITNVHGLYLSNNTNDIIQSFNIYNADSAMAKSPVALTATGVGSPSKSSLGTNHTILIPYARLNILINTIF